MEVDEPIDYSSPAWKLAKSVHDHFAGWEEVPEGLSDDEYAKVSSFVTGTSDCGTQTPPEWLALQPAEPPLQEVRSRAEPRKRTLETGTTSPNLKFRAARLP